MQTFDDMMYPKSASTLKSGLQDELVTSVILVWGSSGKLLAKPVMMPYLSLDD